MFGQDVKEIARIKSIAEMASQLITLHEKEFFETAKNSIAAITQIDRNTYPLMREPLEELCHVIVALGEANMPSQEKAWRMTAMFSSFCNSFHYLYSSATEMDALLTRLENSLITALYFKDGQDTTEKLGVLQKLTSLMVLGNDIAECYEVKTGYPEDRLYRVLLLPQKIDALIDQFKTARIMDELRGSTGLTQLPSDEQIITSLKEAKTYIEESRPYESAQKIFETKIRNAFFNDIEPTSFNQRLRPLLIANSSEPLIKAIEEIGQGNIPNATILDSLAARIEIILKPQLDSNMVTSDVQIYNQLRKGLHDLGLIQEQNKVSLGTT